VSDIQREWQAVLNSIKENDFHSAFEAWEKRWDRCIRSQGETILKEMADKIKLSQHFFFDLVWELSDNTSYSLRIPKHSVTFPANGITLNFSTEGELGCFHCAEACFDSGW
jgi:hypothetical protein